MYIKNYIYKTFEIKQLVSFMHHMVITIYFKNYRIIISLLYIFLYLSFYYYKIYLVIVMMIINDLWIFTSNMSYSAAKKKKKNEIGFTCCFN